MRIARAAALCVFLLTTGSAALAQYRAVELESLKIVADTEWASQGAPGYLPVRFDITNLGDNRQIEISGSGDRWFDFRRYRPGLFGGGAETGRLDVRRTIQLKRGDHLRFTIPVPVFADSEGVRFGIREGGRPLGNFSVYSQFQSGRNAEESPVLVVTDPTASSSQAAWLRPVTIRRGYYAPMRGGTASAPRLDFVLDPDRLPENWLGYTTLRAVAIGPKAWDQLRPDQKEAVLGWTAAGGSLLFTDGTPEQLFPNSNGRFSGLSTNGGSHGYFLGHVAFPTSEAITTEGMARTLAALEPSAMDYFWSLPVTRAPDWGFNERGFRLPIPGIGGGSARGYLWLLVLFTLLIGPANYIYLWRKKQQVLLVLTVPLISAIFIVMLAGYAVIGEGWGVRGRVVTLTVLDQVEKRAVTRATFSLYAAGLVSGGGLSFSRDSAVFALGADGRGVRGQTSLNLNEAQQFSSGLLAARAPSNLEEIVSRPARERLTFENSSGQIRVVNGLGVPITHLIYREAGQTYALKTSLASGEKGVLEASTVRVVDLLSDQKILDQLYPTKFFGLFDHQGDGAYLALVQSSPFWEPGVPKVAERGSLHFVLGYVGG